MKIIDLSAIDRLIDIYGYNQKVQYHDTIYDLETLRDFLEDNRKEMSIDLFYINLSGIIDKNNNCIVKLLNNTYATKDDVIL